MEEGVPLRALHPEQGIGRIFALSLRNTDYNGAAGPFGLYKITLFATKLGLWGPAYRLKYSCRGI